MESISNQSLVKLFDKEEQDMGLLIVVSVCCVLSMLGSFLVILSYVLIAEIRTRSRSILVHLSIADFGAACANLVGVLGYFSGYFQGTTCTKHWVDNRCSDGVVKFCTAQAFLAGYFTLASVLWTLGLSMYMYTLISSLNPQLSFLVARFLYIFSWGLPLLIMSWLLITDTLGYSALGGGSWCSIKLSSTTHQREIFVVIFGNDLWIYMAFCMITILYVSSHCQIAGKIKQIRTLHLEHSALSVLLRAEQKFLLIPFVFLILRSGSLIQTIVYVYLDIKPTKLFSKAMLYISGIGDSGQGIANGLLFCFLTQKVRLQFYSGYRKLLHCKLHTKKKEKNQLCSTHFRKN